MYEDLVRIIKSYLAKQPTVVVLITGHGGSGKSTLANRLAKQFDIAGNQIVQADGLYAKNYLEKTGLFEMHDWPTIIDILSQAHVSKRLRYFKRDDKEVESTVDVPQPQVLILEGIRLLRPEVLPYVDVSVWIDCPIDLATKRAKDRNRKQGDSEAEIALWDTRWVPEAKEYVKQVAPHKIANFIYSTEH